MDRIQRLLAGLLLTVSVGCPGIVAADDHASGQIIVSLEPGYGIEEVNAAWGTTTVDAYPEGNLYLLDATDLGDVENLAEQMEADPMVLEAEANYFQETPESIRHMVVIIVGGGYVDYEDQMIGQRIGIADAHLQTRGAGMTVAVLDTGIDPDHEAFQGRISPAGYDFVEEDAAPWDTANGVDDDLDETIDEGYGHGTMVSGILALVAPEATLLPVRVLSDEGNGDAYQISKGIRYALNQGADVLNLSWGIPRDISVIAHQLEYAREQGVVIVAGAGNDNLEQAYFPAGLDDSEMVTAVDSLDIKASFADWHSNVRVSAPGTGVRSAYPGGQWAMGQGCSFATPFVAGEAALIRSLIPDEPPTVVRARIRTGVVPIGQIPENEQYEDALGTGRIYIPAALDGLTAGLGMNMMPSLDARMLASPNPSTGAVRLILQGGSAAQGTRIYDSAGRLVRTLTGSESLYWDGTTSESRPAAPGIYFIRAVTPDGEYGTQVSLTR